MSKNHDWIPHPMGDFKVFADNFCSEVHTNQVLWALILLEVTTILAKLGIFNGYYAISSIPKAHTQIDIDNTNKARDVLEPLIRTMGIDRMKGNALMTDGDRTRCGVVNDSGTRTSAPQAGSGPVVVETKVGRLVIHLAYSTAPDGQDGVITRFGFYAEGATPPEEIDCTQTVVLNNLGGNVAFPETRYGKHFVGYSRYINTRKEEGNAATVFYGIVN